MKQNHSLAAWIGLAWLALTGVALGQVQHTVSLQWQANAEPEATGYRLYLTQNTNAWTHWSSVPASGQATVSKVLPLPSSGRWFFMVTATNLAGLESDPSNVVTYTALGKPGVPAELAIAGSTLTQVSTVTTVTNLIFIP